EEFRMAILLITHDLGVVAECAERVVVMYAGLVVESAPVRELFERPLHPYTQGLLASLPRLSGSKRGQRLPAIPGMVPDLLRLPAGCKFAPRCGYVLDRCRAADPELRDMGSGRWVRCIRAEEFL
ncbi:MAG: oligopeptide/dipeptide ABC transporter ATP-binding protein, partial [Candidatus Methylomirabilales bacterium]